MSGEQGAVIFCSMGCCPGCQNCYGYSLGCHQDPCRCDQPCDAECWKLDTTDPNCKRHNSATDTRHLYQHEEPEGEGEDWCDQPCPECGATGACGWDQLGRPLIHVDEADR